MKTLQHLPCAVCLLCAVYLLCAFAAAAQTSHSASTPGSCLAGRSLPEAAKELKLGHTAKARAIADGLRRCTGLKPRQRFDLGLVYGRLHDFPDALALFRSVDDDVPSLQAHAYAIALGQFELTDYSGAIETLQHLRTQTPLDPDSTNLLAASESKAGLYQDAYALLVEQVQKNPGEPLGYLNLVTLLTDVGQLEQAEKLSARAVKVFPGNVQMLLVAGAASTAVGHLDEARIDFAAAVKSSPNLAGPRFFLAVTDYKMGQYNLAADELRAAIAAGMVDADLDYLLAECLLKIDPGDSADALKELDRAIKSGSPAVQAHVLRGKLLLEQGDARDALPDLEKAHRLAPGLRSATYNLARAYAALGRKAEARMLFEQIDRQSVDMVNELNELRTQQIVK
jgi:tetratricopeptide (TPR) repeat protein